MSVLLTINCYTSKTFKTVFGFFFLYLIVGFLRGDFISANGEPEPTRY